MKQCMTVYDAIKYCLKNRSLKCKVLRPEGYRYFGFVGDDLHELFLADDGTFLIDCVKVSRDLIQVLSK